MSVGYLPAMKCDYGKLPFSKDAGAINNNLSENWRIAQYHQINLTFYDQVDCDNTHTALE